MRLAAACPKCTQRALNPHPPDPIPQVCNTYSADRPRGSGGAATGTTSRPAQRPAGQRPSGPRPSGPSGPRPSGPRPGGPRPGGGGGGYNRGGSESDDDRRGGRGGNFQRGGRGGGRGGRNDGVPMNENIRWVLAPFNLCPCLALAVGDADCMLGDAAVAGPDRRDAGAPKPPHQQGRGFCCLPVRERTRIVLVGSLGIADSAGNLSGLHSIQASGLAGSLLAGPDASPCCAGRQSSARSRCPPGRPRSLLLPTGPAGPPSPV